MSGVLQYWPLAMLLLNGPIAWVLWGMRKEFASKTELAGVVGDVSQLGKRVEMVEHDLLRMPNKDDLHQVRLELSEVIGELRECRADYRGLTNLIERTEAAVTRHEQIFADAARRTK